MDLDTLIVTVFCLIDDAISGQRLRRRGPQSTLSDAEVLTMEVVGEFLSLDQDKAIHQFLLKPSGGSPRIYSWGGAAVRIIKPF